MVNLVLKDIEFQCQFVKKLCEYFCNNKRKYKEFKTDVENLRAQLVEKKKQNQEEFNLNDENNLGHILNIMAGFYNVSDYIENRSFTVESDNKLIKSVIAIYEEIERDDSRKMNIFIDEIKYDPISANNFFGKRGEYRGYEEEIKRSLVIDCIKRESIVDYRFMGNDEQRIIQSWFNKYYGIPPSQVQITTGGEVSNSNLRNAP